MNTQTQEALKMAGYELDGVIADVEKFDGFDDVCLQTIKRVRSVIDEALEAEQVCQAQKPFGIYHVGDTEEESDFFLFKDSGDVSCEKCIKLYTHPAQPLSADKLERLAENNFINGRVNYVLFGRAIEAAHEIGVK
jgi:hypothetical protein